MNTGNYDRKIEEEFEDFVEEFYGAAGEAVREIESPDSSKIVLNEKILMELDSQNAVEDRKYTQDSVYRHSTSNKINSAKEKLQEPKKDVSEQSKSKMDSVDEMKERTKKYNEMLIGSIENHLAHDGTGDMDGDGVVRGEGEFQFGDNNITGKSEHALMTLEERDAAFEEELLDQRWRY